MKLLFNIDYRTAGGESLALNIISGGEQAVAASHTMTSADGYRWTCAIEMEAGSTPFIDYFYSVSRGGDTMREEWRVEPHRLEFAPRGGITYTVYDHWIDIPEDAHLYSSAFTDCVEARPRELSPGTEYPATLRLKVRAPQLRHDECLAIAGDCDALGCWNPDRAVVMTEHECHEWVASLDATTLGGRVIGFKFVIFSKDADGKTRTAENAPGGGRKLTAWEAGDNRQLGIPAMAAGEVTVYELPQAHFDRAPWKGAGTVIPVFSLRSEGSFGVGDFGDLKLMTDWADRTGQRIIQLLPINDSTINYTWADSYPYNSISIYALHPQYADLRQLPPLKSKARRAHFEKLRRELNALPQIDYERMINAKMAYLRELFAQEGAAMTATPEFGAFFKANEEWLVPYAAFSHYRDMYGTAEFGRWPAHRSFTDDDRRTMTDPQSKGYADVAFWYFVQFVLDAQMRSAHDYARSKRIILKGDIPIGICREGVEAWVEPRYFNMNGQAGAPPDAFSVNGQNWGFPTYNWDEMQADGCRWWVRRFTKMAQYFDAYRIDHVLGFFRIWEIPIESVHGLLGQFSPALGMTPEEIERYGLHFDETLFTRPLITDSIINRLFGSDAGNIRRTFLDSRDGFFYDLKPEYDTQRKIAAAMKERAEISMAKDAPATDGQTAEKLMSLVSNVLFVRDHRTPGLYHPRIGAQNDPIYEYLSDSDREAFNRLYNDYFYSRNDRFWYDEAMKKLPRLTQATRMLVCAEDLGMVPGCVPWVMNGLRILSLEIQSMPKEYGIRFGHLSHNPYRSVCTISTHDMPTLRQWWDEDEQRTQEYFSTKLHRSTTAPHPLPGWLAKEIVSRHLTSPSMLCLLSLQDWLSISERLRLADKDAERINIPANPRHYWRYRMHITIEQLMKEDDFNEEIKTMIKDSGRRFF